MPKTNKNAPEKWGVNKPKKIDKMILIPAKWNDEDVNSFLELIKEFAKQSKASNKPILGNKEKKIAFLSFYAKNKGNINMKAYAESIGVDRTTLYNWIKGK